MNKTELAKTNTVVGQAPRTINSREVAEMTGKDHDKVLRDIRKYVKVLEDSPNLATPNFFIESTYVNSQNKVQPCYELTRKGCDMVANKMTGEKGILFTAAYVTRFEEMEKEIAMKQFNLPTTYKEALLALVEAEEEKERLIADNNKKQELLVAQAPKIDLYNDFVNQDTIYSVNEIAKCLAIKNLGRNKLYKWLRWNMIIIGETYEAYQRYINSGYIVHRVTSYEVPKYEMVLDKKTGKKVKTVVETKKINETKAFFTTKGVEWLYKKLVKAGEVIPKTLNEVMNELTPEEV